MGRWVALGYLALLVVTYIKTSCSASSEVKHYPLPSSISFSNLGGIQTSASTFYIVSHVDLAGAVVSMIAGETLVAYYTQVFFIRIPQISSASVHLVTYS